MANRKNLANGALKTAVGKNDTTWILDDGFGATMPTVPFFLTATPLGMLSTLSNSEIVSVTAVDGDSLTVVRAQKGTDAKEFSAGDIVANGVYVEDLDEKINKSGDTVTGDLDVEGSLTMAGLPVGGTYIASQVDSSTNLIAGSTVAKGATVTLYTNSNVCTVYEGYTYDVFINCAGLVTNPAGGFGVYFKVTYPGGNDTIPSGGFYPITTAAYQSWYGVLRYTFTPTSTGALRFDYIFQNETGTNTSVRLLSGSRSYEYNYHQVVGRVSAPAP